MTQDQLYVNAAIATLAGDAPYGLIENGALAVKDGRIAWAGTEIPDDYAGLPRTDLQGRLLTPALIDCHTHLVYAGSRAQEFEARLEGVSYEEIARRGGGIKSTVRAVREADEETLIAQSLPRLDALIAGGAGTVEIKSGYGLDLESERRMLRAARKLGELRDVRVKTTFLGAHALPPDYASGADAYIDEVCETMMPALAKEGLVDAVDMFCEGIGFSAAQSRRVMETAKSLGLPIKIHAEQLSDLGGAKMAAEFGALSADHLEYLAPEDAPALAEAGTVAVLLPGAFYYLRESQLPPMEALREAGVAMAVATDCNPGTSPMTSLLLAMNMACVQFRMTPEEALAGVTREAARALGLERDIGTLEKGKRAELAVWDVAHPAELAYKIGFNPLHARIIHTP